MKPNKEQLKTALRSEGTPHERLMTFIKAAQYLLSISDDLDAMIEAREKATEGIYEQDTDGEIITKSGCTCAFPVEAMFIDASFCQNTEFFVTAANAIANIAKEK